MRPLDPLDLPLSGASLIEASAGTGKTFMLSNLYLRLVLERKLSVEQILVVTFTNAATEELRDRIRRRISNSLQIVRGLDGGDEFVNDLLGRLNDPSRAAQLLSAALTNVDQASIFTIHQFCQRMLSENAFESGAWFDAEIIVNDNEYLKQIVEDFWRREFYLKSSGLASLVYFEWESPENLLATIRDYLARPELRIIPEIDPNNASANRFRNLMREIIAVWKQQPEQIRDLLYNDQGLSRQKNAYKSEHLDLVFSQWLEYQQNEITDYCLPYGFSLFGSEQLSKSLKPKVLGEGGQGPRHIFFYLCQEVFDLRENKKKQIICNAIEYCREEIKRRKHIGQVLSFDDLILNLNGALSSDSGNYLANKIRNQFPAALIDEFQDTDPSQYEIFRRIYYGRNATGLCLIGDPKQAIYSFRGADIFTYMKARRQLGTAKNTYSLNRNWRSAPALVEAVNCLFENAEAPFLFEGEIDFHRVEAADEANKTPLVLAGAGPEPMRIWFIEKTADNQHQGKVKKNWAKDAIAEACAVEIISLLNSPCFIGNEKIEAKDITVLVRDRHEARIVQQSMGAAGLDSSFISRDSVFESEEAELLYRILAAVVDFGNPRYVRSALATKLVGFTGNELDSLFEDEVAWQEILQQFQSFHALWSSRGFIVMFHAMIHQLDIPKTVSALDDHERRMTNLLHLGELLQVASQNYSGMEPVVTWFNEQRMNPDGNNEAQQLRLETDRNLIKVVTIHKCKGLEFPVVFIPFLWSSKKRKREPPFLFHRDPDWAPCLELGSADLNRNTDLMLKENLAEELRILYVALTRAKCLCYFAWGNISGAAESALSYLLCQPGNLQDPLEDIPAFLKPMDDEELFGRLTALAGKAKGCIRVSMLPYAEEISTTKMAHRDKDPNIQLRAKKFQGQNDFSWRMTSYSRLLPLTSLPNEPQDHDAARTLIAENAALSQHPIPEVFKLPGGLQTGRFFHELMESLDFPAAVGESLSASVAHALNKHGLDREMWQSTIEILVSNVLDTKLEKDVEICLRKLTQEKRLVELKFYFPLNSVDSHSLNGILNRYYDYPAHVPGLDFGELRGMMQGFIDLVFEWDGRYYVLDYKSNHLGYRFEDYSREKLWSAMLCHRYDLQFLIYSIAVHRYLRDRLPQYQYSEHFGGVYYLFIRGMDVSRGAESGIFFDRPDARLIEDLDALFSQSRFS